MLYFKNPLSSLSLLIIGLALSTGCGGPAVSTVSGKLTYKGEPVPDVRINLMNASGKAWFAKADSSGAFSGFKPGDGVPAGDYTVTLIVESEAPSEITDASAYAVPKKQKLPFPKKYSGINSSDLKVTIEGSGEQTLNLELTD